MTLNDVPEMSEAKRGCGFRKGGSMYLVGPQLTRPCGKLPITLERCATCGEGFSFSRAMRWVDPTKLIPEGACETKSLTGPGDSLAWEDSRKCLGCPAANVEAIIGDRAVLIWIGEGHYATPRAFMDEAVERGISRHLNNGVPKGFEVGKDWVLLAHAKCGTKDCECEHATDDALVYDKDCTTCKGSGKVDVAGIFTMFKPTAVEYVCRGDETDEELDALVKRNITPVRVKRIGENAELPLEGGEST